MRRWILALSVTTAGTALVFAAGKLTTGARSLGFGVPQGSSTELTFPEDPSLAHSKSQPRNAQDKPQESAAPQGTPFPGPHPALAGLDLTRIAMDDRGASAPLPDRRVARLTLDPDLQRTTSALMASHHLPEAVVVLSDVETGNVLVYASHLESGPARDLAAEATAPAASVFKIVTATALVESAQLTSDTQQCYSGGEHRIHATDLEDNPQRDKYCASLASAMGRSLNTVFARLALRHLRPSTLEETAMGYGFGKKLPFDVEVQPSGLKIPAEPLGFARTAAGFWNTTLSPLEAIALSTTIARGGEAVRLNVVREVQDADGKTLYAAPATPIAKRVIRPETAQSLTTMLDRTVSEGTSYRAFRDSSGRPFLPGVPVAGKTGTLTDAEKGRLYTWFTGFAPSRPMPAKDVRPVAVAALVVNKPAWHLKANVLAREVLRAYFAQQRVDHVTPPPMGQAPRPAIAVKAPVATNARTEPSTNRARRQRGAERQPVLSARASSRPRTSSR